MTDSNATSTEVDDSTVIVSEPTDGVRLITLNRPDRLNAMNSELINDLYGALSEAGSDLSCRAVVLTGAGRAFCAGLDLSGYGDTGAEDLGRIQQTFHIQKHIAGLIDLLRGMAQPVICAANGAASGGGFALLLGSDIRLASTTAKFNAAFVRIGLSACDIGTSWLLPRIVGAGRAHEMMLTGRYVEAEEALRIGLVTDVVEPEALLERALEQAAMIASNSPMGVRMTKEVMWSALEIPGQRAAIDLENRTQVMLTQTSDHVEAIMAFLERRDPGFTNH